jgi:hypothetical protein
MTFKLWTTGVAPMASCDIDKVMHYAFFYERLSTDNQDGSIRSNDKNIIRDDVGLLSRLLTKKTLDTCTSTREKKQDLGCHGSYCVIFWKRAVLPA